MLPSLRRLVIHDTSIATKRTLEPGWPPTQGPPPVINKARKLTPDEDGRGEGGGGDDAPTLKINCEDAETMMVFRAQVFNLKSTVNTCLVAGGRIQMPGMTINEESVSILCPGDNLPIKLKMATLNTKLDYSDEQFLFHATTDSTFDDDGHFRYFAFDASHSANYACEESSRRGASKEFMHVFRVKSKIPNLALFADSNTWADMSGRMQMLEAGRCDPKLETLDAETVASRKRDADALGMVMKEYNWSERIRDFKTTTGETLNGFIATTSLSATAPHFIVEPKFELMLNVPKLADYLEHVKCYKIEEYVGEVDY